MLIKTRYFGTQEVDPQSILFFPEGLPGFESCHRFKLFHEDGEHAIIHYLQSLDNPEAVFSVVEPSWLGLDYELTLSPGESMVLKFFSTKKEETLKDSKDSMAIKNPLLVLVMLAGVQENGEDEPCIRPLTAQPLIINPSTRRGIQLRLTREDFDTVVQ
ncbi:flagellar assembly factor FliW [Gammaproteobacteria bacterium]